MASREKRVQRQARYRAKHKDRERGRHAKYAAANRCKLAANAARRRALNPGRANATNAKWRATHPERAKAATAAWRANNPAKVRATRAEWLAKNPGARSRVKASVAKARAKRPDHYSKMHRRNSALYRARIRGSSGRLSAGEWESIVNEWGGLCAYCGNPATTMDHLVAVARGGRHDKDNVVPACRDCNLRKQTRLPLDFIWRRAA